MQNPEHIIGVDLSKKTIDLFYRSHLCIQNHEAGFQQLLGWLEKQNLRTPEVLMVMEHTGLYSYRFEQFLQGHNICFCKVPALEIKNSMGMVRGKSDKMDAKRIACYGLLKKEQLTAEAPLSPQLQRLQLLYGSRDRMVRQRAALLNAVKEYENMGLSPKDPIVQGQKRVIKALEKEIGKVELEMDRTSEAEPSIKENLSLLQSIKGVGKILSIATILKTHNFTRFATARKFACFCGTAPFENSSGTSLKARPRVSHLADKKMKTLLDLSAKCAVRYDPELREYYLKRVESGKSKMSTINIVRNKIIYRMFAVIKRKTPFVENYKMAA